MNRLETGRTIVNNNIGLTNVYGKVDLRATMVSTIDTIVNGLMEHCGPFGSYAIIVDPLLPTSPPTFTKDGINIVKAMDFGSPIENVIRRMVIHIGSAVDRVSGDGTTSSIILTLVALAELIKSDEVAAMSYGQIKDAYDSFVEDVTSRNNSASYPIDGLVTAERTRTQLIKAVAFHQAYTSSHGDIALSELAAQLFSSMPEEAWDNIVLEHAKKETTTKYSLVEETSQYSLPVNIFSKNMCNTELKTRFMCEGASLLVIPTTLTANTPMFESILKLIRDLSYADAASSDLSTMVIITMSGIDTHTRQLLLEALAAHSKVSKKEIAIFTYGSEEPLLNELTGLCLVGGVDTNKAATVPTVQESVKLDYKNGVIRIDGLYDNPEGSMIHPYVNDKTFPKFDETLETILGMISKLQQDEVSSSNKRKVQELRRLHNKIFLTRNIIVRAGGNIHDMASSYDLIEDVIRACKSSLLDGFTAGNNYVFRTLEGSSFFDHAFRTAARKMAVAVGLPPSRLDREVFDILSQESESASILIELTDYCALDRALGGEEFPSTRLIIQPSNITTEILKRFGELALRLLNASKIVTPGGIVRRTLEEADRLNHSL